MNLIKHIGIIPDGNRRWAMAHSLDFFTAYQISVRNLASLIENLMIYEKPLSISVYLLSQDNLSRKRNDIDAVIEIGIHFLSTILPEICDRNKIRVIHAGNPNMLPGEMVKTLSNITFWTEKYVDHNLYLLLGYDPIDEINSAYQAKSSPITIQDLWVPERVDCVIRTAGGPVMLSKFLPLQSSYSQLYIIDKFFNDCTFSDFSTILEKSKRVKMLYGK